MGGPVMNTGSFADIYTNSYLAAKEDQTDLESIKTLKTIVYPFRFTSLHYFTICGNVDALEFCFKKRIKWTKDVFGKDPLDYALESMDKSVLEAIY